MMILDNRPFSGDAVPINTEMGIRPDIGVNPNLAAWRHASLEYFRFRAKFG
jgi:hypothetical protein